MLYFFSHFINKFLLIGVPQIWFHNPIRQAVFSHLTTLISITHHYKAYRTLPMMSQFKNPLETKLHLIKLAWVQAWLRKLPLHSWGKPEREPFCTVVSGDLLTAECSPRRTGPPRIVQAGHTQCKRHCLGLVTMDHLGPYAVDLPQRA